jgi:hypothetical protein
MGREARVRWGGFDRVVAQARRVQPAGKLRGATQRLVGPAAIAEDADDRRGAEITP